MIKSIIVAVAENNVIGKDNQLVWRLPADMKYFKDTTTGHPVIMGRKTFESFKKPLRDRTNIVITRNQRYQADGAVVVHNLQEAVRQAEKEQPDEIFILGGAEIYRQSMDLVDRIYLTEVKDSFEGDAFFPEIDRSKWREVKRDEYAPDERNPHAYAFVLLERNTN